MIIVFRPLANERSHGTAHDIIDGTFEFHACSKVTAASCKDVRWGIEYVGDRLLREGSILHADIANQQMRIL